MTLEEAFARLAINSGRIADALEALTKSQGIVANPPEAIEPPDDDQEQLDLKPPADEKPEPKPKVKKEKKKKNEVVVGKTDDETPEWDLPGIRGLLHKLQEQENQAAVKSVLKKFGASTLGQVDKKKFVQLAETIESKLDD